MKKILGIVVLLFCVSFLFAQNEIEGVWFNSSKTGKVEIYKKENKYFGKIIWLKEPISETTGQAKVDINNPDKDKQDEPIVGLVVLKDFIHDGDNLYKNGTIYDPENGKTYKCKMTLKNQNELDVRGYIGVPAFGRTENWTRATK